MLYMFVLFANTTVIFVVISNKVLHKPMHIFLCHLAVNGIYGSTALLPPLLGTLMSPSHEVSLACCKAQTYFLHTYAIIEFTILSVMCYDRYVAICCPLQYHAIMTITKVYKLIAFSWGYPLVAFALFFILTLRLTICRNIIGRVYCSNYSLVNCPVMTQMLWVPLDCFLLLYTLFLSLWWLSTHMDIFSKYALLPLKSLKLKHWRPALHTYLQF